MRVAYCITGFIVLVVAVLFALAAIAVIGKAAWAYVDWSAVFIFTGGAMVLSVLSWLCFSKAKQEVKR